MSCSDQGSLDVAGDVAYTCETAGHFYLYQVLSRWEQHANKIKPLAKKVHRQFCHSLVPCLITLTSLHHQTSAYNNNIPFNYACICSLCMHICAHMTPCSCCMYGYCITAFSVAQFTVLMPHSSVTIWHRNALVQSYELFTGICVPQGGQMCK